MHKKGLALKAVVFLIAIAIIAIIFLMFYLWYSSQGDKSVSTLQLESKNLQESNLLNVLLNVPIDEDKTIADSIALGEFDRIKDKIDSTMKGKKYNLYIDGVLKYSSALIEEPVVQKVILPTKDMRMIEIELRLENE